MVNELVAGVVAMVVVVVVATYLTFGADRVYRGLSDGRTTDDDDGRLTICEYTIYVYTYIHISYIHAYIYIYMNICQSFRYDTETNILMLKQIERTIASGHPW